MRQVVRDPTAAAAKGAAARKYVVDHFSLLAVAHKLLAQLLRVQVHTDYLNYIGALCLNDARKEQMRSCLLYADWAKNYVFDWQHLIFLVCAAILEP
eukprot:947457-Pelagomonas_calceolata.AAC.1